MSDPTEITGGVLYLTTVECRVCDDKTTYAHRGPWVGLMRESPEPDVSKCPQCGDMYPQPLAPAIYSVHEAEIVPPSETNPERKK